VAKTASVKIRIMDRDVPYENESFIELQKLPAITSDIEHHFCFVIQHKGSEVIYQVMAKDRDELAAKIAAGEFHDIDPRNDASPADLDEDATDE
jgi:hypothetical protein